MSAGGAAGANEPTSYVVTCTTDGCPEQGSVKVVSLQHLGQGVYLDGVLVCGECGETLRRSHLVRGTGGGRGA